MKIEIDQSNKIEDSGDTYLGFSNGISQSICIPFVLKQEGMQVLRKRGKTRKQSRLLLFSACVYLLIKKYLTQIDVMIIDNEYDGHGSTIRSFVYEYIKRATTSFDIKRIRIQRIGKKSRAHDVVWRCNAGKNKADWTLTLTELLREIA